MNNQKRLKLYHILISKFQTENKLKLLRKAIETHVKIMTLARNGNGIDRHLFGLWCVAFEENLDVPALYNDPLYSKRYSF